MGCEWTLGRVKVKATPGGSVGPCSFLLKKRNYSDYDHFLVARLR